MADDIGITAQVVMRRADGRSILDLGPVTADSAHRTSGDLPPDRIAEVRKRLEAAGFTVLSGNANTLSVTAASGTFVEVFGLDPAEAAKAATAAHGTRIRADLAPFVAAVFVPPPPEFFP